MNDGGPAFHAITIEQRGDPAYRDPTHIYHRGMSLRAYAAIKLRVPDSGIDWLDEMIIKANCDWFAAERKHDNPHI